MCIEGPHHIFLNRRPTTLTECQRHRRLQVQIFFLTLLRYRKHGRRLDFIFFHCQISQVWHFSKAFTVTIIIIRPEARLQPNIVFTLLRILVVFTRSAITPPKVNRFGRNLQHSESMIFLPSLTPVTPPVLRPHRQLSEGGKTGKVRRPQGSVYSFTPPCSKS